MGRAIIKVGSENCLNRVDTGHSILNGCFNCLGGENCLDIVLTAYYDMFL